MSHLIIEVREDSQGQIGGRVVLNDDSGEFMVEALALVIRHHCQESGLDYDNFLRALQIINQVEAMEAAATVPSTGSLN